MKKTNFFLMLISAMLITSCGGSGTAKPSENMSGGSTTSEAVETEPPLEIRDFDGREFVFYVRWATDGWDWNVDDLLSEEENGEPVNDAVYKRNQTICERYNCSLTQVKSGEIMGTTSIRSSVLAGDGSYDAIIMQGYDMVSLGREGLLIDLLTLEDIDTTKSYWNPTLIKELSLGGKLWYAMGDLSATDNRAVRCLYFNKELFEDYQLENPYDLVKSGQWTFDKFLGMVTDGKVDLDGDGDYDTDDQWGLYVQPELGLNMYFAGGGRLTEKDADDLLTVTFGEKSAIELMTTVSEGIQSASDAILISNDYLTMIPSFADGHSLFYSEVSLFIERFRKYDFDVGMIPMPKADEYQEDYCQYADGFCLNFVGVPMDSKTPDDTALLLEALSAESPDTLTKAYYDICLTGKSIRDEESGEMLDIIFNNYTIDYINLFNNNYYIQLLSALRGEKEVASTVASALEAAKAEIDKVNETLK